MVEGTSGAVSTGFSSSRWTRRGDALVVSLVMSQASPARRARFGGDGQPHRHQLHCFRVEGLSASDEEVSENATFGGKPQRRAVVAVG